MAAVWDMKKAVIAAVSIACAAAITLCGCSRKVVESNDLFTLTEEQYEALLDYYAEHQSGDSAKIAEASAQSLLSGVSVLSIQMYRGSSIGSMLGGGYTYYDAPTFGSGVIVDLDKENGDAYVLTCCHNVYDDEAYQTYFADTVYLYLYGQDVPDVNYSAAYEETTYSSGIGFYGSGSTYYKLDVTGDDDYRIEATVVAASSQYDLALLKVTGSEVLKNSNAVAATFADAEEVAIGQSAYTVGQSVYFMGPSVDATYWEYGSGLCVTSGNVSKDCFSVDYGIYSSTFYSSVSNSHRVIETSAAVNEGCGGGGLYNADGELIGIICDKIVADGTDNIGYAIPASQARRVYELMKDSASDSVISYPGLSAGFLDGVSFSGSSRNNTSNGYYLYDVSDPGYEITDTATYLDPNDDSVEYRVRVKETVAATSSSYGLQEGDVITHITITDEDGVTVEDLDVTRKFMLDDALISYRDGYTVTLAYVRDGVEGQQDVSCSLQKIA